MKLEGLILFGHVYASTEITFASLTVSPLQITTENIPFLKKPKTFFCHSDLRGWNRIFQQHLFINRQLISENEPVKFDQNQISTHGQIFIIISCIFMSIYLKFLNRYLLFQKTRTSGSKSNCQFWLDKDESEILYVKESCNCSVNCTCLSSLQDFSF